MWIRQMATDVLVNGRAYDQLRELCKTVGPRLSGSPESMKAIALTAGMLKDAGADTVYLQPCMVTHWIRGEKETGYIESEDRLRRRPLHLCSLGKSIGTGKMGIKAPVVEVTNFRTLDSLGKAVKGKIVFFNMPMDPANIRTFESYGKGGAGRREGPARAAKYGAVGVLVRSLASNPDDFPHTGVTLYNDSFPRIPAMAISTNDAIWLSRELAGGKQLKAFIRSTCQLLPDTASFNVIGELKGSEFPQQIITVGGHLDSWDLGEGAHDDGAGVVQSMEVIRAFKASGIQPKRTIRAVLFMDEESGGKGAQAYLKAAIEKGEQHLFALESDAGGFTPRGFQMDMKPEQQAALLKWKSLFHPYGVYDFIVGGGGSDIGPLKKIGTALAGLSPDSQRYFDLHHAANDVFEQVSKRELLLGAINMTILIYLVDKYGL